MMRLAVRAGVVAVAVALGGYGSIGTTADGDTGSAGKSLMPLTAWKWESFSQRWDTGERYADQFQAEFLKRVGPVSATFHWKTDDIHSIAFQKNGDCMALATSGEALVWRFNGTQQQKRFAVPVFPKNPDAALAISKLWPSQRQVIRLYGGKYYDEPIDGTHWWLVCLQDLDDGHLTQLETPGDDSSGPRTIPREIYPSDEGRQIVGTCVMESIIF